MLQARDGEEALRRFEAEQVDLVVLDLMLPKLDGLEVCRRLRAQSAVPIIMLTARDDELDKVRRARARRRRLHHEAVLDPRVPEPRAGAAPPGLAQRRPTDGRDARSSSTGSPLDLAKRTVELDGQRVELTYVEFELLRTLAAKSGRVYSRQALLAGALGRLRLPGAADDRRPRAPPAREARRLGADPDRARRRLPVPRREPAPERRRAAQPRARRSSCSAPSRSSGSRSSRRSSAGSSPGACPSSPRSARGVIREQEHGRRRARTSSTRPPAGPTRGSSTTGRSRSACSRRASTRPTSAPRRTSSATRSRSGRPSTPGVQRGRVSRGGNDYAEAAVADRYGRRPPLLGPASRHARGRRRSSSRACSGRAWSRSRSRSSPVSAPRRSSRAGSGGSSARPSGSPPATSTQPVEDHGRDELGELAGAFDRMRLQLARLDDARREFIANASHELRTPIFSLGGFLELLSRRGARRGDPRASSSRR